MDSDLKNGVETSNGEAPAAEPSVDSSVDLAAEYEALLAENARLAADRDNYRKGMLAAKGKSKVEEPTYEPEEETEDDRIARKVREVLSQTQAEQARKRQEEIIKQALKENRELKAALQNRSQISSAPASSSKESPEPRDSYFTDEQIAYLKKRGLDPAKVKENLLKAKR